MFAKLLKLTPILIFPLCFCGCARRGAPPGGPPDEKPPGIVSSTPESGDVLVPIDSPIEIVFDEPVKSDPRTVLIQPDDDIFRVKFKRKAVRIEHSEPLRENTTYSVILSPRFSDRHGNELGKAAEISFSTGEHIDTMVVFGYVIDGGKMEYASGAVVAAYSDSLMGQAPVRISYSSVDGAFRIGHLPAGRFWVFAGTGLDENFEWRAAEKVAVPSCPAESGAGKPIYLFLSANDTIPPRMMAMVAADSFTIRLKFSENIELNDLKLSPAAIVWLDVADSASIFARFGEVIVGDTVSIYVCDRYHNCSHLDVFISPEFVGVDTLPPSILKMKGRNILPDDVVRITATEPFYANISVEVDGTPAGFDTFRVSPNILELSLREKPPAGSSVKISLKPLRDLRGNTTDDSLLVRVMDERLGDVKVKLSDTCGNPIVFLRRVGGNTIFLHKLEDEFFRSVPGGRYTLWRFCDLDSNLVWTPGKIGDFTPSEPIEVFSDTIFIRPGWETEVKW